MTTANLKESRRRVAQKLNDKGFSYIRTGNRYDLYRDDDFLRQFQNIGSLEDFVDRVLRKESIVKRKCMCCRETFKSEGIHNRLCCYCSKKTESIA